MPIVIEKVAAVVRYIDSRVDEGYIPLPLRCSGQSRPQSITLTREDGIEIYINLDHVVSIEQATITREK